MSAAAAPPLLAAEDVSVVFDRTLRAVDRVSFTLAADCTMALVGESGSGKTTLGKTLVGLWRPTAGRVLIEGEDVGSLAGAGRKVLPRKVQMIFQDPLSSLSPRLTIRRLIAEPLAIHGLAHAEHWPRVEALMAAIGLPAATLDKYPHQVSGGQARRVGIARALVLEPRLLIADEPTAGLDVSIQGDLLNLLADLRERYGLTILMISHNLNVVRRVTDQVAVMYLGTIVEEGPTRAVFERPAHPYTHALLAANPAIDPARRREKLVLAGEIPSPHDVPSGCRFHTRCPRVQELCRTAAPALTPKGEGRRAACHFPLTEETPGR
jgi:peptide/nickel transport system ATP-binding protein